MPTFAAVDIGANSVRLKIARLQRGRLHVVHEDREVTRLGQSVFHSGLLSPDAMSETVNVLRRFHRAAQSHGADVVRVVATSALRDARNATAFTEWVRSTTGWNVEVISGLEEGRLIHLGVTTSMRRIAPRMLLVDLGGGSCELTVSFDGQIRDMVSLPVGAVRLTQEFLHHDPPKKKEIESLRGFIAEEIARVERKVTNARVGLVIATSGTPAALAAASGHSIENGANATVSRADVEKLAKRLPRMDLAKRRAIPGIGPRRAEIIIAGSLVFSELMRACNLRQFRYSSLGLRDGLLAQMEADFSRNTTAHKRIESERWNALVGAGKHYGINFRFAERVREHVLALFSGMKRVHALPDDYQEWLGAAAMLHEVGSYINRAGRHRHTRYIIANSELFGYTTQQKFLIAAIARYVGKSKPTATDRIVRAVGPAHQKLIPRAVSLLRLARALDLGRRGAISSVSVRVADTRVLLKLHARRGSPDLEVWALEKERAYFRAVFGRELSIALA